MEYKRIEQMSGQMYNTIGFCPNFVGTNHKSLHLKNLLPTLSNNTKSAILYFQSYYSFKKRIVDNELCLQTIFSLDWTYLKVNQSIATIDRITKELRDNNLALRLSRDTYVVNIDYISVFTLPQRKRYIDIITHTTRYVKPDNNSLSGSAF